MRRRFKRKLVISETTTTTCSRLPDDKFTRPVGLGVPTSTDLAPVKLRRFSKDLTNIIVLSVCTFEGMPVQQPKLLQDLGKRWKAWRSPTHSLQATASTTTIDVSNDNSLTDSGVGVALVEDSGVYAEIGVPTVKITTGSRPSSAPSKRSSVPAGANDRNGRATRPRSKSLKRSSSSARRARELFRCTSGQRSRSCTPERNVSHRINAVPGNMGNAGADEKYLMHSAAAPVCRPAHVSTKGRSTSAILSFRRLSFRRKSLPKEPGKQSSSNNYCDVRKGLDIPKEKDAISKDSGQDSETDYESVSSGSPETWLKHQRSYTVSEGSKAVGPRYSGITEPPDLPAIRRVDHLYGTVPRADQEEKRKSSRSRPSRSSKGQGQPEQAVVLKAKAAQPDRLGPPLPLPRGAAPPPQSGVTLVKIFRLDKVLTNKWISGVAVTKKNEYIVVDLRSAYLLDEDGNLKKMVGAKGSNRLQEPIDVAVMPNGNLVFSDHAEQDVKVFNWKGQYLRKVKDKGLPNIAGVATNEKRQIFIAGTDKQRISVHSEDDELLYTIPRDNEGRKAHFEHPYSVAVNPLTGDIIVGDDYKQLVTAVSPAGKMLWRFCPPGDRHRHFFPSSICVDNDGYVFIADLYNEKVYMLDSSGKYIKTVLSRGEGLKGGPGAVATDGRGHLIVADEEKTLKVFKYGENGFAVNRRFSYCPAAV